MTESGEPRLSLIRDRVARQLVVLIGGVLVLGLPAGLQVLYLMVALPLLWSMRSYPY